jgi:prepilin-type N-terminal cleavage/methylation domain-containing protein
MCSGRNKSRAFTLLEVMLAVMVMAMIALVIYRFVVGALQSIKISTELSEQQEAIQALVSVLQSEFDNLPPQEQNALLGEPHKFNNKDSDQIVWLTAAGNGVFTQTAPGSWKVTLLLRPQDKSDTNTLGLLRQLPDNSNNDLHWLPLLPNVDAIRVRYYDQRLNAWLDKWSDAQSRPSLVWLRIWRAGQTIPYEKIIQLPPVKLPS